MPDTDETVAVTAYVRATELREPIETNLEALRRLESADRIDALTVETWPAKVPLSAATPHSDAIDAFERMAGWADEHDFAVRPPFGVRTLSSSITNERRTVLATPAMALVVSVDERVAAVFPHSRGNEQYSVRDGIDSLSADALETFPVAPEPPALPPDRCPVCANRLTTVQGLGVCRTCERIELGTPSSRTGRRRSRIASRS